MRVDFPERSSCFARVCLVCVCSFGSVASASPGDHIRVGAAEVTPSVQFVNQWQSNVYLQEDSEQSGLNLQVVPGFSVELDGNDIQLSVDASYTARQYLDSAFSNLNQYSETDFEFDMVALPNSTVGFDFNDSFSVSTHATEATYADRALITHITNNASGSLSIHPGGALDVDLGGHLSYDDFFTPQEASLANTAANLNSKTHYGPKVGIKWTFFPRTAFVLNYAQSWFDWDRNLVVAKGDETGNSQDLGAWLAIPDGATWRVTGGLMGRFTPRLLLNVIGGYGQITYDEQTVIDYQGNTDATPAEVDPASVGFGQDLGGFPGGIIGKVQLEWSPNFANVITLGYSKDFEDSWFTNYLSYHYGFLRYKLLMGAKLGVTSEFGYRIESYVGEVTRTDQMINSRVGIDYHASSWLDVGINTRWTRRLNPESPVIEYDDLSAALTFTATY